MGFTQILNDLSGLFLLHDKYRRTKDKIMQMELEKDLDYLAEKICKYFGLPRSQEFGEEIDSFLSQNRLTIELLDRTRFKLTVFATHELSQPVCPSLEPELNYENVGQQKKGVSEPIVPSEVWEYVEKHISEPLSDKEWIDIQTGFRLLWNYSFGQSVGSDDFKHTVDLYLTSIDNPMDRETMAMVVDKILEYLELIGQYGCENN